MATISTRTIQVVFTGDATGAPSAAAQNTNSPGQQQILTLASGDNTITAPTGGSAPEACTIEMPVGNVVLVKLKGAAGDTGVKLHALNPTSIALDATQTSFILNAASQLVGARLIWS